MKLVISLSCLCGVAFGSTIVPVLPNLGSLRGNSYGSPRDNVDNVAVVASPVRAPCAPGCVAYPLTNVGTPTAKIRVDTELTVGNGTCTGTQPECAAGPCSISGTVKITNISGGPLWYDPPPSGGGRVKVANNAQMEYTEADGTTFDCGSNYNIDFYDVATGGLAVAFYNWRCTTCPGNQ